MKNKDMSKSLPKRSAYCSRDLDQRNYTATIFVNGGRAPTCNKMAVLAQCKRGLSLLDHMHPRAIKPSEGKRLDQGTFISVRSLACLCNITIHAVKIT